MTGLNEIGQMMEGVLNAPNRACNDLTIKIRFCDKSINEIKGYIEGSKSVGFVNAINDLNLGKQQMQHALELLCSMRKTVIGWAKAKGIAVTPSVIFLKPDVPMSQEEKGSNDSSSSNNSENNKQRLKLNIKHTADKFLNARFYHIKGGHSREEDLKAVNPNYVTGEFQWTHNCQRCVMAYEARRRGYNVQAKPCIINGDDPYPTVSGIKSVFEDVDLLNCSANSGTQAKINIEDQVKNWDDNARGMVIVYWKLGGGHIFIVEKTNGIIRYVDPQTGKVDASGHFERAKGKPMYCFRTDNLEFTNKVYDCIQ